MTPTHLRVSGRAQMEGGVIKEEPAHDQVLTLFDT